MDNEQEMYTRIPTVAQVNTATQKRKEKEKTFTTDNRKVKL